MKRYKVERGKTYAAVAMRGEIYEEFFVATPTDVFFICRGPLCEMPGGPYRIAVRVSRLTSDGYAPVQADAYRFGKKVLWAFRQCKTQHTKTNRSTRNKTC